MQSISGKREEKLRRKGGTEDATVYRGNGLCSGQKFIGKKGEELRNEYMIVSHGEDPKAKRRLKVWLSGVGIIK